MYHVWPWHNRPKPDGESSCLVGEAFLEGLAPESYAIASHSRQVAWLQSCRYKLLLLNLTRMTKDNAKFHLVLFKLKDLQLDM